MKSWNSQLFPARLPAPTVEPVQCPRCRRMVERATTAMGEGGYRACADARVCTATAQPRSASWSGAEMNTLGSLR